MSEQHTIAQARILTHIHTQHSLTDHTHTHTHTHTTLMPHHRERSEGDRESEIKRASVSLRYAQASRESERASERE